MIDLGTLAGLLEHGHRLGAYCPAANAGRNAMQLFGPMTIGGEGGIRTLGQLSLTPVFKSQDSLSRATHAHADTDFPRMAPKRLSL